MPTGSVSKEDMFGSDDIGKLCAKYDKDGNGQFDIDECAAPLLLACHNHEIPHEVFLPALPVPNAHGTHAHVNSACFAALARIRRHPLPRRTKCLRLVPCACKRADAWAISHLLVRLTSDLVFCVYSVSGCARFFLIA